MTTSLSLAIAFLVGTLITGRATIQRPTGVTKPVLARLRLTSGSGGCGTSATASLALISASTSPGGRAARKNGST